MGKMGKGLMMRRTARRVQTRFGARWRDERGGAAVELALIMPVLVLLLFGIIEFARVWNVKQVLTDAAREGTRIAVVTERQNLTQQQLVDSVTAVVQRAATAAGIDITQLTIDTSQGVGGEPNSPARVQLTYQYQTLFGTWILPDQAFQLRTSAVMRNE